MTTMTYGDKVSLEELGTMREVYALQNPIVCGKSNYEQMKEHETKMERKLRPTEEVISCTSELITKRRYKRRMAKLKRLRKDI